MPIVEVSHEIPSSLPRLWAVVNDVESYPALMDHVRSVDVLEDGESYRVTAWEVELGGCHMRWVEREEKDPERHRIEYRQVEGDMAKLEGFWQLESIDDNLCRATLTVEFDIGIPMLSEMLNPVAEHAIRENSRSMLMSIASAAALPELDQTHR